MECWHFRNLNPKVILSIGVLLYQNCIENKSKVPMKQIHFYFLTFVHSSHEIAGYYHPIGRNSKPLYWEIHHSGLLCNKSNRLIYGTDFFKWVSNFLPSNILHQVFHRSVSLDKNVHGHEASMCCNMHQLKPNVNLCKPKTLDIKAVADT